MEEEEEGVNPGSILRHMTTELFKRGGWPRTSKGGKWPVWTKKGGRAKERPEEIGAAGRGFLNRRSSEGKREQRWLYQENRKKRGGRKIDTETWYCGEKTDGHAGKMERSVKVAEALGCDTQRRGQSRIGAKLS